MSAERARGVVAVVLAAGRSKRFGGGSAKVLHPLCGRPLVAHVLSTLRAVHRQAKLRSVCLVVPPGKSVEKALDASSYPFPLSFAVQRQPRGTGDAVSVALRALGPGDEVLVLAGDAPLVRAESLVGLIRRRRKARAEGALLTAVLDDGGPYGRVMRENGWITGVVEERDATPDQLAVREINTCTYAFTRQAIARVLPRLRPNNAQKEIYFTDVVAELVADGGALTSFEGNPDEVLGANTRAELATVARLMRERILDDLMDGGVTIVDPATTYVDAGVVCGPDTVLEPNTFLRGDTKIGSGCLIGPNTHLVDTSVGDGAVVAFSVASKAKIGPEASVGPFANLRHDTVLARGAKAGSFAEMKNARIGEGSKVPHFSYMGDVTVGSGSNIGAGTITCNYDGKDKHPTTIGEDVFIGSDSILVAPVRVGRGAYTGAGSVVTQDVRAGELVYGVPATRRKQVVKKTAKKKVPARRPVRRRVKAAKRPSRKGARGSSSARGVRGRSPRADGLRSPGLKKRRGT